MSNLMSFDDNNWDSEVIRSKTPVLVDFIADWCAPCRKMSPIIASLASELEGKIKVGTVDIDKARQVSSIQSIHSVPTIMVFDQGTCRVRRTGMVTKNELLELLEDYE